MSLNLKRSYPLLVVGLVPTVLLSVSARILGALRYLLFGFRKQEKPILLTIGFSHYCDKVRWALELINGYDFEERPYLPLFHIPVLLMYTGGKRTMTPTLVTQDGRPHSNSSDIFHYLQQNHPETASFLYPPSQKTDIEEFEKLCDDKLGPNARILAYAHIFSSQHEASLVASVVMHFTSPGLVLSTFLFCFPMIRQVMMFAMNINEGRAKVAFTKVDEVFAEANRRLSENGGAEGRGGYLCNTSSPSAADLAFAALAYPVVFPPEHGWDDALESSPQLRALAERYRNTPAGKFVLRLYRERGPVQFRRRKCN